MVAWDLSDLASDPHVIIRLVMRARRTDRSLIPGHRPPAVMLYVCAASSGECEGRGPDGELKGKTENLSRERGRVSQRPLVSVLAFCAVVDKMTAEPERRRASVSIMEPLRRKARALRTRAGSRKAARTDARRRLSAPSLTRCA